MTHLRRHLELYKNSNIKKRRCTGCKNTFTNHDNFEKHVSSCSPFPSMLDKNGTPVVDFSIGDDAVVPTFLPSSSEQLEDDEEVSHESLLPLPSNDTVTEENN